MAALMSQVVLTHSPCRGEILEWLGHRQLGPLWSFKHEQVGYLSFSGDYSLALKLSVLPT